MIGNRKLRATVNYQVTSTKLIVLLSAGVGRRRWICNGYHLKLALAARDGRGRWQSGVDDEWGDLKRHRHAGRYGAWGGDKGRRRYGMRGRRRHRRSYRTARGGRRLIHTDEADARRSAGGAQARYFEQRADLVLLGLFDALARLQDSLLRGHAADVVSELKLPHVDGLACRVLADKAPAF